MTYIAPLDLQTVFLNSLAGSLYIFMAILFISLSILAGYFKMEGKIYLLMGGLAGILMYSWLPWGFYILIVVMGGLLAFFSIKKLVT